MFIRLPTLQSQDGRQAHTRRAPLTPSTATPPSVSTQSSSATRRDSGCGDATKARAILSRVASSPSSPKRITPPSTPKPHPHSSTNEVQRHPAMVGGMERRWTDTQEAVKYWDGHQQRGMSSLCTSSSSPKLTYHRRIHIISRLRKVSPELRRCSWRASARTNRGLRSEWLL
jgi:hypothetical protein